MKRLIGILLCMGLCLPLWSQEATEQTAHILFEGVEVKGDIYEFSEMLQKRGYKLERRDNNVRNFVFKGNICGHPTQFMVSFTRHSKTVYRLMAQMKRVPLDVLVDSLTVRYGEPYDVTQKGYQWQSAAGAVMLATPEGYDPTLVVMDGAGVAAFKEEENRQH